MKILVVDDSFTMRRILARYLHGMGEYDIFMAENGKDAFTTLVKEGGMDLIITDWLMPVMDGIELTARVRRSPWKGVPILMVTTNAAHESVIEALRAGVDNYLVKPFSTEALGTKVNLLLNAA